MKESLVTLQNICFDLPDKKGILRDISLEIQAGDLICLIGLNGTGKTTLLKIIQGILSPSSGTITQNTQKIAYIPQYHDIDMTFPVTVEEFFRLYGKITHDDVLNTKKLFSKKLSSLSGGQLQRVMIAVALSQNPELLLFDEPTSGIDIVGEHSFYALIQKIRTEQNIAMVLVSHDIHLVLTNATKVICLSHHICCQGTPMSIQSETDFQHIFGQYLKPYHHHHDHHHGINS